MADVGFYEEPWAKRGEEAIAEKGKSMG